MRIKPIEHISPSKFYKLRQCALAEVWSISGNPSLIPYHANALLGSVIHKVLEKYSCDNTLSIEDFEQHWQQCERSALQRIHPDEQWRYQPLSEKATYYFTKKFNTKKAVEKLLNKEGDQPTHQAISEHPLNSNDGLIKGIADLVIKKNETNVVSVIDFKTGKVHKNEGAIKEEYIEQLKLYAVLYNHNKDQIFDGIKEWPDNLYIVSSDGSYHAIPYTYHEAEELYLMVKSVVNKTNEIIGEAEDVEDKLSNTGEHCKYCSYRVVCKKFINNATINEYDFVGVIRSLFIVPGNKKVVMRFEDTPWVIHYFLQPHQTINLSVGQKIIAVNLRKERGDNPIAYTTSFSVIKAIE